MLKLAHLTLNNYRCFERFEMDFHPELTVLVAINGAGKTSILDAIAVAFGPFVAAFDRGRDSTFHEEDVRTFRSKAYDTQEMEMAAEVMLEARGDVDAAMGIPWSRNKRAQKDAKTTYKEAKALTAYGERLQELIRKGDEQETLPVVTYYGTGRLWSQKRLMEHKKDAAGSKGVQTRSLGYEDCLDPSSTYRVFVEWFKYCAYAKAEQQAKTQEVRDQGDDNIALERLEGAIRAVAGAVDACLQSQGWSSLEYSITRQELRMRHAEHGWMPVDYLSDGLRSMVAMVADIAYRAVRLNPHLMAEAAQKTPGIVLVDEVDMHLHPSWQQTVLPSLRKAFPLVQFIVTTHSPQVLTTVPRECVRVLEAGGLDGLVAKEPEFSPLGRPANDALAGIFHTAVAPEITTGGGEKLETLLGQYEQLVRAGRMESPEAKNLAQQIAAAGHEIPEASLALWRFLAGRRNA